jgi:hypothetical protein
MTDAYVWDHETERRVDEFETLEDAREWADAHGRFRPREDRGRYEPVDARSLCSEGDRDE